MPIYTYRCKKCGHQFDQRQRMSDDPLTICPVCEGDLRRIVNSVGVVFKGSGFYVTDNRSNNSANGVAKAAAEKDSSTEGKSSPTKVDAKETTGSSASVTA